MKEASALSAEPRSKMPATNNRQRYRIDGLSVFFPITRTIDAVNKKRHCAFEEAPRRDRSRGHADGSRLPVTVCGQNSIENCPQIRTPRCFNPIWGNPAASDQFCPRTRASACWRAKLRAFVARRLTVSRPKLKLLPQCPAHTHAYRGLARSLGYQKNSASSCPRFPLGI
jgi:hypothetical protein